MEPNPDPEPGTDPSMEEILASIKRVINEDKKSVPAQRPAGSETPANAPDTDSQPL